MFSKGAYLRSLDNTGVRLLKCIHIFDSFVAKPGSSIIVSVKNVQPNRKIKKGEVYLAVIVQLKKPVRRSNGYYVSFNRNAAVLIKRNDTVPLGNRVLSFILEEVKSQGYYKLSSLSLGLLL